VLLRYHAHARWTPPLQVFSTGLAADIVKVKQLAPHVHIIKQLNILEKNMKIKGKYMNSKHF